MGRKWRNRKEKKTHYLSDIAAKHGIFVVQNDKGIIDFIDVNTGKSLGLWYPKPNPWFVFKDVTHAGTPKDALRAIVAPYDLRI